MGYHVTVECNVVIKKAKIKKALKAINAIPLGSYAWVNHTGKFKDIKTALKGWRYVCDFNEKGDVSDMYFNGEKVGDDETLFKALAPYIEKNSYVGYLGEDGAQWRYVFDGKTMTEKEAKVLWE